MKTFFRIIWARCAGLAERSGGTQAGFVNGNHVEKAFRRWASGKWNRAFVLGNGRSCFFPRVAVITANNRVSTVFLAASL
jgi:hypothetical protein